MLGITEKYLKVSAVIGHSQHAFMEGRSYLTSLIFFSKKVTHIVDERNSADVTFLYFSKAFRSVSHFIPPDKMSNMQLDLNIMQ